ncbi:MAG TPA: hypothetical protein VMF58_06375 [Rhizomicrobium sp.]|nr:hypothetical protein [Rhizomicrobium sp.]
MSDDQSDFTNKTRRSKVVEPEGADASVPKKPRKKKAARKAEKAKRGRSASVGQSAATHSAKPASDEERAKAKAERKAEKKASKADRKAKKAEKKASRAEHAVESTEPVAALSSEDRAKAKAERKTQKAANKAKRREGDAAASKAVAGDEDRAKAKEGRRAEKAANKANRTGDAVAVAAVGDTEKAKAKAERKAGKIAKKEKRKAKKAVNKDSASADGTSAAALGPEEKAKAKAERKAAKAAKKAARKSGKGDDGEEEGAETGRRARRKARKADGEGGGSGNIRIALRGLNQSADAKIRTHIEKALANAGGAPLWEAGDGKTDLAIYAFDDPPLSPEEIGASINAIAKDRTKFHIFVGRSAMPAPDGSDTLAAENHAIAMLACALDGAFVDTASLFRRHGADRALKGAALTDFGAELLASAILAIAAGGRVQLNVSRPQWPVAPDLDAARALSASDLLAQLSWSSPKAPKLLWTHASTDSMQAFLDRKVAIADDQTLSIELPVAWPAELPNRAAETQVLGLEFLAGPLNYWYSKAGNSSSDRNVEIDALIKERGVGAGEILARAGKIIVDFADRHPVANSKAWEENAVSRRARVLALFVLCCRMAVKRNVKFDEAILLRVFHELLNMIEVLRAADFYAVGSFDGIQQDSLVAGLALALRKTAYAEQLLAESMDRLKTLQLNVGLTADGVWRNGTFSDHCTLLAQFKTMLGDFNTIDVALKEPVAAAAKKMTVFAEALLKSDGAPPVFDNSQQKSYLKKLAGTRRALAGAGFSKNAPPKGKPMPRITDTYVFRDAQYFASHTSQSPSADSSLVILHRERASVPRNNPGGISLVFAHGENDLLVGADPQEGTKKRDKEAYFDAALRNGYRINGSGYVPEQDITPGQARLVKSWRGEGWAAAKGIDRSNPAGSVIRTAIHLKSQHALIVVDALESTDGRETSFEQFWHIAPGFTPSDPAGASLCFAGEGGNLMATFDTRAATASEPEGEGGTCIRCTLHMTKGVVATLFQWSDAPAPSALKVLSATGGGWSLEVSGAAFEGRFELAGEDLRYAPKTAA